MNVNNIASEFLNKFYMLGGDYILRRWRGDFYLYDNGCYYKISEDEMKCHVIKYLRKEHSQENITTFTINSTFANIKGEVNIPATIEANSWLEYETKYIRTLSFNNGFLVTYPNGDIALVEHSPKCFILTKLPYNYNVNATCPNWIEFLKGIMDNDLERIQLLQQWAGYLLTPDLRKQKFLLCLGEGANGKGVFFETMENMLGRNNCSHVLLARFGDKFSLYHTLGKLVNSSTESSQEIGEFAENQLKAYTAGDPIDFEKKHGDIISAVPTAKVMIATNELPRFKDRTNGVWRRLLYVPFNKDYPEEHWDEYLADKLSLELSGIFNWAMKADLTKGFIKPEICREGILESRRNLAPEKIFLQDLFQYQKNESVTAKSIYSEYKQYCEENGFKPQNNTNFGKAIKREFPNTQKVRLGTGQRDYVYEGLSRISNIPEPSIPNIGEQSKAVDLAYIQAHGGSMEIHD